MKDVFIAELKQAGIPTTEEEFKKQFAQQLDESGFFVKNESPYSPFWRLQTAIAAKPAEQLVNSLVNTVMPNSLVMLANDDALDLHGRARGLERLEAVKAVGRLTFYRTETGSERTIPSGTIVESLPLNGRVYQLKTIEDCNFKASTVHSTVYAEATETGSEYNLAEGYYVKVLTEEDIAVTNNQGWLITAGQNIESNDNFRERIRAAHANLGNYHVDFVYKNIIATHGRIPFDNIVLEKGAPRGPGTANAYVYLDVGVISQTIVDSINKHIKAGHHGLGDDLWVSAIDYKNYQLTATFTQTPGTASIKSEIESFIRAVFREHTAYKATCVKPSSKFSFSKLKAELHAEFTQLHSIRFDKTELETGFWLPKLTHLSVHHE